MWAMRFVYGLEVACIVRVSRIEGGHDYSCWEVANVEIGNARWSHLWKGDAENLCLGLFSENFAATSLRDQALLLIRLFSSLCLPFFSDFPQDPALSVRNMLC